MVKLVEYFKLNRGDVVFYIFIMLVVGFVLWEMGAFRISGPSTGGMSGFHSNLRVVDVPPPSEHCLGVVFRNDFKVPISGSALLKCIYAGNTTTSEQERTVYEIDDAEVQYFSLAPDETFTFSYCNELICVWGDSYYDVRIELNWSNTSDSSMFDSVEGRVWAWCPEYKEYRRHEREKDNS